MADVLPDAVPARRATRRRRRRGDRGARRPGRARGQDRAGRERVPRLRTIDSRRHTEHGRERKQELLDAAAELFLATGYRATRIEDICGKAGVSKGLFYWYFPTKQALFEELVREMRHRLRRAQADAMDAGADAPRPRGPRHPRPRHVIRRLNVAAPRSVRVGRDRPRR